MFKWASAHWIDRSTFKNFCNHLITHYHSIWQINWMQSIWWTKIINVLQTFIYILLNLDLLLLSSFQLFAWGTIQSIEQVMAWCLTNITPSPQAVVTQFADPYMHQYDWVCLEMKMMNIWVRSRNCGCRVTWFCYQLIAKPSNKTAAVSWLDPYIL